METNIKTPPTSEEATPTMVQRIVGVLLKPHETMEIVIKHPLIWKPMILLMVFGLIQAIVSLPILEQFVLRQIAFAPVPPGQSVESFQNYILLSAKVSALVTGTLAPVISCAVVAFMLWTIAQFTHKQTFHRMFSISIFAFIPKVILGGTINTALNLLTNGGAFLRTPTSLAIFFPKSVSEGFLFVLCSYVEVFTVWTLILASIGGAAAMKTSVKNTLIPLAGVWLAVVLILAGLAGLKFGI